jgi:hypothetical protein
MRVWEREKVMLKNSVIDWLLEENQPSVRYLALTELLGLSEKDAEVKSTKENIATIGWAKDILENKTRVVIGLMNKVSIGQNMFRLTGCS